MEQILFTQADWQLFTNINTLPQQAGVSKFLLPRLIAKELIDNALDTGAEVSIEHIEEDIFKDTIIVKDFGQGFGGSNEEIANLFSIKRPLTSSKRFRLPLRGALGNGLRVVTAMVYCTNGSLEIATRGRTIQLFPQDDGTTKFEEIAKFEGKGTEIKVTIPDNYFSEGLLDWANLALKINQGEMYQGKTNGFWYDSDSFYNLLLATPAHVKLNEFLNFFEGLNAKKISEIVSTLPLSVSPQTTSVPNYSREEADTLLNLIRQNSKEISVKKLGFVGELENFTAYQKELVEFELKTTKGKFDAKIPAVIEVFGRLEERENYQFFVNKTPITGDLSGSYFDKRLTIYGCGLSQTIEISKLKANPVLWVNIITPYMPIVSNGKEPDLSVLQEPIFGAIKKVLAQLKKQEPKNENTDNFDLSLDKSISQKQVVLENLDKAIEKASGNGQYRYSLRQLYYALRPFVMQNTGKELKYANFNQIITDYEYETGKDVVGIYRDERGTLLHPHTHEEIRLGTKSIEKYQRPIFNFNKILYSEKEGFFEILKDAGFCEKYDIALLTSKGFASRAARDVIDLLAQTEEELLFFCIHDADISGTLIYQALQGATKARPERKVHIINLGLEAWEGLSMNLEVESLEKKSTKTPAKYVLDFDQDLSNSKPFQFNKYERWADWSDWLRSFRVELNAMDTPTFIAWLDKKIAQYDNVGKVIPNEKYLQEEATQTLENTLRLQIKEAILKNIDLDTLIEKEFVQQFPELKAKLATLALEENLRENLNADLQQSWRKGFLEVLNELLK